MKKIKLFLLTLLSLFTFNSFSQGTVVTVNVVNQTSCQYTLTSQYWDFLDSLSFGNLQFAPDPFNPNIYTCLVPSVNFQFFVCANFSPICDSLAPECVTQVVLPSDSGNGSISVTLLLDGFYDVDGDGWNNSVDCDDSNALINPGMPELCNEWETQIDYNCDGIITPNNLQQSTQVEVVGDSSNPGVVYIVFSSPDSASSIVWSVNSSPTDSSDSYPQFTLTGSGQYDICVSIMDSGCYYDTCVTITVDTLGNWSPGFVIPQVEVIVVPELPLTTNSDVLDFKLYPNPVVDRLNIVSNRNISTVEVWSVFGTKVKFVDLGKTTSLDLSGLASGIYYVKISDKNGNQKFSTIIK
jgi:hypothetical protein